MSRGRACDKMTFSASLEPMRRSHISVTHHWKDTTWCARVQKTEDNRNRICASGEVKHGPFMVQHVSHSSSESVCVLFSV